MPQLLIMPRIEEIWRIFLEHRWGEKQNKTKKHAETDCALMFHPTQSILYELDNFLVPEIKDN